MTYANNKIIKKSVIIFSIFFIVVVVGYLGFSKTKNISYSVGTNNVFKADIAGYYKTCLDNAIIYQRVNNAWKKIIDDFPSKGGYYLDDKFIGYGWCDNVVCNELPQPFTINLVEHHIIGTKPSPVDSAFFGGTLDVYQTVPLHGDVKIEISYFSDKNCKNKKFFSTQFNIK